MYKTYTHGEYREIHKSFNDLHKRASDKDFKIISRSLGNMGVELCYNDGTQNVYLLICSDDERNLWWKSSIED